MTRRVAGDQEGLGSLGAVLQAFLDGAVFGTSSGAGPPIALLLHGWRRDHEDFAGVAATLAASGIAALAIDLPGFGATPAPAAPSGARGYAAQLGPLLGELAAASGPLVLVGHSFGGRVAVCLAAKRPEAVAGLVLSGVPLVRSAMPTARPSRRYRAIRAAARLGLVPAARLEAARRRYGSADYRAATGTIRDVLVATVGESYDDELAAIRCPVTLVWGGDDTTAPLAVARAAQAICTQARLEVLDGVGHLVPTEAPERLAAAAAALLGGAH
ncbi:MAG TPA: alpha/beta hydrolase [Acidimicrobiales bacterium]|nr:alpha/beta hydrolase [Acidimicrobiales bacterium]